RARRIGISSTCASITQKANGTTSSPAIPGRRPRRSTRTRFLRSSFPVCRKPWVSATRTPSRVPRRYSRSTPCSAGCMCFRRVWFWTRAAGTTTSISISRKPTSNLANNTGGHVMASFLLGAPSLIEQDYLLADAAIRSTEYSAYVGDDWRASEKLTLNIGLRYELDTPPSETSNLWANFDPTTATVLVAGRNGVSETAGVKTFKK